jgi:iron(III) transport system substrate-binding protein
MRSTATTTTVEDSGVGTPHDGGRAAARRFKRRWLRGFPVLAGVVALFVAGCGGSNGQGSKAVSGSWNDVAAAAEKEGRVTLYSGQGFEHLKPLTAAFERKYPNIKVEVVRGIPSDLAPKVEAEARTGKGIADVYVSVDRTWLTASKNFFVAPRGPAFDAPAYDRSARVPEGSYFEVSAQIMGLGWNTTDFSGQLRGYPDLLDPNLAGGKIGIIKAQSAAIVDFYQYLTKNHGVDFLEKLATQRPRIYPSALPMVQALSSGELTAAAFVGSTVKLEKKAGAPVDWGVPKSPWGARYYGTVLKSAPHPNAAQVFADFLVTEEGQKAVSSDNASALPNIPGAVESTNDVPELANLTPETVQEFQAKWDELFGS